MQDGLELPDTLALPAESIRFITPNGERFLVDSSGEDDELAAIQRSTRFPLAPKTWRLPFGKRRDSVHVAGARQAKAKGAPIAAIVCRLNSPLAALADVAAVFDTGPEAVEGSDPARRRDGQKAASASSRPSLQPNSDMFTAD